MKATPSSQLPGSAAFDHEPTPLPPPPPDDGDDDAYFVDDDEPSWWSTIRPLSAVRASGQRPHELEVLLPPLQPAARMRARTANDEVCATAHVLRVRARLSVDEQHAFDELMRGPAATDIITMLVNRSEDDAVEKLQRRLDDEPRAVEDSRRALATKIAAVGALLSRDERASALAALASLWPEELIALHARLVELPPPEAGALIRTYLAPRR